MWEKYASKQKYIASDEFTLAGLNPCLSSFFAIFILLDVMVAPYLLVMCRFGSTLKDYPNLKKYCDLVKVSTLEQFVQNELFLVAV